MALDIGGLLPNVGGFGFVIQLFVIFFLTLIIGAAVIGFIWFFVWRPFVYRITVMVQEPTGSGQYLWRKDRMRVVDREGQRYAYLLRDKKAIVEPTVFKHLEAFTKGGRLLFLRRVTETEYVPIIEETKLNFVKKIFKKETPTGLVEIHKYVPLDAKYSGGEIDFKPISANVRNMVLQDMKNKYKKYQSKSLLEAYTPFIAVGMLGIIFLGGMLFMTQKWDTMAASNNNIADAIKVASINLDKAAGKLSGNIEVGGRPLPPPPKIEAQSTEPLDDGGVSIS